MEYFLILGKNHSLSSAEIAAVFKRMGVDVIFITVSSEAIVFQTSKEINASDLMARLGGTVKIGKIIKTEGRVEAHAYANVVSKNLTRGKKVHFGFSLYKIDEGVGNQKIRKLLQEIKKVGMKIKNELKQKGFASRWVTGKERALSSVIVKKNKLLDEAGTELVILVGKDKIYLGKTLAVQEFEEYSFRDYGRPKRSMKVGLLPPKLAKIMINLAEVNFDQTILDPFCGFGTILGEAMLVGYQNLIGSDINPETLAGAKENLEWLKKNYKLQMTNYKLIEVDAQEISKKLPLQSVDAIVTEPFLGPPLLGSEPPEKIQQIIEELSKLYLNAFLEFKKILKPNGKIVILFPLFQVRSRNFFLPILDKIKKIGFISEDFFPKEFRKYPFLKITPRNSIIYSRPDQIVWRELFIFKTNY